MPRYVKLTKGTKEVDVVDTSAHVWKERGWKEKGAATYSPPPPPDEPDDFDEPDEFAT